MYAGRKVEEVLQVAASVREDAAPSVYEGLLGAVPRPGSSLDGSIARLVEILGTVLSLKQRIAGCVFGVALRTGD